MASSKSKKSVRLSDAAAEHDVVERAQKGLDRGKSASTAAGEFVREEIEHVREGKHGARSAKQAIAIGLSKARRAGVPLGTPAEVIAQNAATLAVLSGERFTLGLGSGENLNEHVVGAGWPPPRARQAMLSEAVDIIEQLWTGEELSHEGEFFEVDRAQLWDVPKTPPRLAIAAGGSKAAELAGKKGAGLFATEAKAPLVEAWRKAGGRRARYAEVAISYAKSEEEAVRVAHERFSFGLLGWKVLPELPTPKSFEGALAHVKPQDVAESITCGPDPERHVQAVRKYIEAGFDHLVLVGVGPDQHGFLRFWKEELAPRLRKLST